MRKRDDYDVDGDGEGLLAVCDWPQPPDDMAASRSLVYSLDRPPAPVCPACGGTGLARSIARPNNALCRPCHGSGFTSIDPTVATCCKPGSFGKQSVLAARYATGAPLWQPDDAGFGAQDRANRSDEDAG